MKASARIESITPTRSSDDHWVKLECENTEGMIFKIEALMPIEKIEEEELEEYSDILIEYFTSEDTPSGCHRASLYFDSDDELEDDDEVFVLFNAE